MGLVFYYLFHYLFFFFLSLSPPLSPPPLSPGIEGKHKSAAASLLCAVVYIAVICSGSPLRGGSSTTLRRHMWPLHGGFSCCSV